MIRVLNRSMISKGGSYPPGIYTNIMRGQSVLGNPYRIGKDGDRDEVIAKYRRWLWAQVQAKTEVLDILQDMASYAGDINLVCCCAPKRCHGEIVKRAIEWIRRES